MALAITAIVFIGAAAQFLGLITGREFVNETVQIASHDSGQIVNIDTYAMISHAVLRVVIGANLLAARTGTNLIAAGAVKLGLDAFLLQIVQTRTQDRHCLGFILKL